MRTRVKICGITNLEDAQAATAYGADALGFILVPQSQRYVEKYPNTASIPTALPPFVSKVVVCETPYMISNAWENRADTMQFYAHGYVTGLNLQKKNMQAFRIKDATSLEEIATAPALPHLDAILLDTYHKDTLGGSGETFNWQIAVEAKRRFNLPIILAGGLTPENVGEAVRTVRPYAVDVSSGVEISPGRKDHAKIKAFIEAVRQADME